MHTDKSSDRPRLSSTISQWTTFLVVVVAALVWPLAAAGGSLGGDDPTQVSSVSPEVEAEEAEGLSLLEVVQTALAANPGIQTAMQQMLAGEGALSSARSQFSPNLNASVSRSHSSDLTIGAGGLAQAVESDTETTSYSVALTQQLRAGLTLQPSVTVNQTSSRALPSTLGTATVNVDLIMPLLRDRWAKIANSNEQAAEEGYESDLRGLNHQQAASILETVAAYWDYLSAHYQLDVYQTSEERAQLLVEETQQLVESEERPAADLNQVRGNLAGKSIDRINAEQGVISARKRLGIAMGIPADQIPLLQVPGDDFPELAPFSADAANRHRLAETALQRRADLEAANRQLRAAELLYNAAKENLKPRLNLVVSAGYTGADEGTGLDQLLTPLHRNIPGMTTSLLLDYSFPVGNLYGKGAVMQQEAALEQQRIASRDLARRIKAAVDLACEDLVRSALAAHTAEQSVVLNRTTVENEKEKNRLGVATLFDVILAEDRLTGALLNRVISYRNYAVALASLRYETGLLVHGQGTDVSVHPQDLLVAP